MSEMILVATKPNEQIYWVLDSKEPDGVAIRDGNIVYLESFWNYVTRGVDPVIVLGGTDFLSDFWKRRPVEETAKFASTYIDKTTPIPNGVYKNIKPFLVDVPKASTKKVDGGADLAMVIDVNKAKKKPRGRSDEAPNRTRKGSGGFEISTCSGFLERGPNGKFSPVGDSEPQEKSFDDLIEVKAPRSPLKMEAYDPDARDGDGDGIVQENTPWERPAATRLMDAAGKLIERGRESSSRPSGMRVVDADGNDVDYTPTYERSRTGTIGAGRQVGESTSKPKKPEPKKPVVDKPTQEKPEVKPKKPGSGSALSDHGAGSLKERGMRDVRAAAAPPPPPEPKKPEPEKPEKPEGDYRMSHQPSDDGPRAFDLTEDGGGDWSMPSDVYDNPNLYTGADATVRKETMEQLERVRGNPDGLVTVYRYAPEGREFEVGNWVSLSRTYAQQHGESNPTPGGTVQSMQVPAREVRFAGDDLAEFGWHPEPVKPEPEKPDAPKPDVPDPKKAVKADIKPGVGDDLGGDDSKEQGDLLNEKILQDRADADDSWRNLTVTTPSGEKVTIKRNFSRDDGIPIIDPINAMLPEIKMQNAREVGALLAEKMSIDELNGFDAKRQQNGAPMRVVMFDSYGRIHLRSLDRGYTPEGMTVVDPSSENYKELFAEAIASQIIESWANMGPGFEEMQESASRVFGTGRPSPIEVKAKREKVIDAAIEAMYENTQRRFKEQGITEVVLHRGMSFDSPNNSSLSRLIFGRGVGSHSEEVDISLRPLSSFSFNWNTAAYSFGELGENGGSVMTSRVPVERIFSLATTGSGCYDEEEAIVIGGGSISTNLEWNITESEVGEDD